MGVTAYRREEVAALEAATILTPGAARVKVVAASLNVTRVVEWVSELG